MKVLPILNFKMKKNNLSAGGFHKQNSVTSDIIAPQFGNIAYMPVFQGLKLEDNVIKKVIGKQFYGKSIFNKDGFIDFSKIGSDKLKTEDLDITKATKDEITAYRYSLALSEAYECSWVNRYNPFNRKYPLATHHTLNSQTRNNNYYATFLEKLHNPYLCKSLDVPVFDKKGNLCLNGVVFDTETTGISTQYDKIIQLASMRIKQGHAVAEKSAIYNKLLNPETHIPENASAVNGITDEMVKDAPTINGVLKEFLTNHLTKSNGIIIAYNGKFDINLLNRNIREYNVASSVNAKEKQEFKMLDPFILLQRIHPFVGAKKKLSYQYQWLFCKNMENAHDALADVRGTIDVLKYCLYYIEKHHSKAGKGFPISLREVLAFQYGSPKVKNIDIPIDTNSNFNSTVSFAPSYKYVPLNVDNYFRRYNFTSKIAENLRGEIGEENFKRLQQKGIINTKIDGMYKGHKLQPEETENIPNTTKSQNLLYVMKKNMKKVLGFANLEDYNGKTKDELEDLIIENSKEYINNKNIQTWIKNVDMGEIKKGNDLPDIEIAQRVMRERQEEDKLFDAMMKDDKK